MKTLFTIITILCVLNVNAQIPAYYNDVDLTLTGMALKSELSTKISSTHTNQLDYTPDVWNVLKLSDLDPENSNKVLLVYGYNDTDTDETNDRSRSKNANGGSPTGEWNREHVFPKSIGTPDLGTSGPGADAHNLKPADVDNNGDRGNRKYSVGTGNGGTNGSNWYPGDEWKGDVARIYMYMYLRYGTQCKPGNGCVGNPVSTDLNMVDILLTWNAQDPVNDYEKNRNTVIYNNQGNRNPFIDNPYLATLIWGGTVAENFWETVDLNKTKHLEFNIYPNPTKLEFVELNFNNYELINSIVIFDISGKSVQTIHPVDLNSNTHKINNLTHGIYFVKVNSAVGVLTKKIIVK